jgi:4-hydroxy-2-oxovalerate aldolase
MDNSTRRAPEILDCTLRDGSHAVGHTFTANDTRLIVAGLVKAGIDVIEIGKSSGLGSDKGIVPDEEYLDAAAPFMHEAEIGMFCRPEFFKAEKLDMAAEKGIGFLRVGTDAGKTSNSSSVIPALRQRGIKVRFSLMKAHTLTPEVLAEEARKAESYGAQVVTIMDSTGTFLPEQVKFYVSALVGAVDIPVGFHGHNNLGLAVGNALAALEVGASSLDGSLTGLARSAGNAPTEMLCAVLGRLGIPVKADLSELLRFIDTGFSGIVPETKGVPPLDLVFGIAGFHSRDLTTVKKVSDETGVDLYELILAVAKPGNGEIDEKLTREAAASIGRRNV